MGVWGSEKRVRVLLPTRLVRVVRIDGQDGQQPLSGTIVDEDAALMPSGTCEDYLIDPGMDFLRSRLHICNGKICYDSWRLPRLVAGYADGQGVYWLLEVKDHTKAYAAEDEWVLRRAHAL